MGAVGPLPGGRRDWWWRPLVRLDARLVGARPSIRIVVALVFTAVALGAISAARSAFGRAVELQFAGTGEAFRRVVGDSADDVVVHLRWDVLFILTSATAALLWASLWNSRSRARPSVRLTAYAVIVGAAVTDLAEDLVTWRALEADPVTDGWAQVIAAFAGVKWFLVAVGVVLARGAVGRRLVPSVAADDVFVGHPRGDAARDIDESSYAASTNRWFAEATADEASYRADLDALWAPRDRSGRPQRTGIGISCSGGGIRSASFCLGALHGLGPGLVRRADYLAAASGGAYIASAMTAVEYAREAEATEDRAALALAVNAAGVDLGATPGTEATSEDPLACARAALDAANVLLDKPKARVDADVRWIDTLADRALALAEEGTEAHEVALEAKRLAASVQEVAAFESPLPFGQVERTGNPAHREDDEYLRRLRARVSYLLLNGEEGRISIFRAVSGVLINLFVLALLLFAVARPLGYAMSSSVLHPELRANYPLLRDVGLVDDVDLTIDDFTLGAFSGVDCPGDVGPGLQAPVRLVAAEAVGFDVMAGVDAEPKALDDARLRGDGPSGVVEVCGGRVEVIRQPDLAVVLGPSARAKGLSCEGDDEPAVGRCVAEDIEVSSAGLLEPVEDVAPDRVVERGDIDGLLEVGDQPTFTSETGGQGRDKISIDAWMWIVAVASLVLAMVFATFGIGPLRGRHELTTSLPRSSQIALGVATGTFVVAIALPWLSQELPARFGDATSPRPGSAEGVWGFLVWLGGFLVAARASLAGLRKEGEAKTSKGKRKSRLVLKVGALVFLVFTGLIALFTVLQSPVLNGPMGRIHGGTLFWDHGWARQPDLVWLGVVVAVLLVLRRAVPTYVWSLNPLYRDRLGKAFLGDSRDRSVPATVREMTILGTPRPSHPWPELVVCGAVNLNSSDPENCIPAGRWADSFTFSREAIGSPATEFVPSVAYAGALADNRHTDLQLSSLLAVSGAAFSPGMGKEAYGALGGLLAVLNLRLGLWLPSPAWVTTMNARRRIKDAAPDPWWWPVVLGWRRFRVTVLGWIGRTPSPDPQRNTWRSTAGWPYLVREVFGQFRRTSPYVYVTDGGHWENLGLVELIRRGCTEIYVLSAAGDGAQSFSTAGEAIALAREQFGVDIRIELTPLRARSGGEPEEEGRQLLDLEDGAAERSFAPAPYAVGWFTYANGVRARILFIEANLTDDLPWDVHSHAERHSVFPDDSTMNQFFNHRQFESYRRLGLHQATKAKGAEAWDTVAQWCADPSMTEAELRELLAG